MRLLLVITIQRFYKTLACGNHEDAASHKRSTVENSLMWLNCQNIVPSTHF